MTDNSQPGSPELPRSLLDLGWRGVTPRRLWNALHSDGPGGVLLRGAVGAFLIRALGAAAAFGVQILLARTLGAVQYGIYVYAVSWAGFLVMIPVLGFDTGLLRFVASYNARQMWPVLRGVLLRSHQISLAAGIATAIVAAVALQLLAPSLEPLLFRAGLLAVLLIPALALTSVSQASLRGFKRVVLSHLPEAIVRPLSLALLVGLFLVTRTGPITAPVAMGFNVLAAVAGLVLCVCLLRRAAPVEARRAIPEYRTREWISTSLPLLLASSLYLLLAQIDTLMLGLLQGTRDVGIYNVAARMSVFLLFGMQAVNIIAAPMISEIHSSKTPAEMQRLLRRIAAWTLTVTTPVLLLTLIAGRWLLGLFGEQFEIAYFPLVLLCLGQFANALSGPCGFLLTMTGHERESLRILWLTLAANVALNAPAIHYLGIEGLAAATAVAFALRNVLMWRRAVQLLGVDSSVLALLRRGT